MRHVRFVEFAVRAVHERDIRGVALRAQARDRFARGLGLPLVVDRNLVRNEYRLHASHRSVSAGSCQRNSNPYR